jgi:hypothetical protein
MKNVGSFESRCRCANGVSRLSVNRRAARNQQGVIDPNFLRSGAEYLLVRLPGHQARPYA